MSTTGRLIILPEPRDVAKHVANWLADRIAAHEEPVRIALSGGSTPKLLFAELASDDFRSRIAWHKLRLFWGDERFVPHDHPDSNYRMTRETLLGKVPIPPEHIFPIPGTGTPDSAAAAYEKTLQSQYGASRLDTARPLFDVTFLGLGEDGHTASLIPGQPELSERTHWVVPVTHGRPEARITLTYPALESTNAVAFLVTGAGKQAMLREVRSGTSTVPAARLHPHGELLWFADRAAAGE